MRASDCWQPRTLHGATQATIHNIVRTLQAATPLNYACATQAYDGRQQPQVVTLPPTGRKLDRCTKKKFHGVTAALHQMATRWRKYAGPGNTKMDPKIEETRFI